MIRAPIKIRSINLNPTQAPYLVLFMNMATFLLHSRKELHSVALASSPVSTTEISFLSSDANDSSRFSPPGPSPRRYQKDRTSYRRYQRPTAADFFSPRSSRHPSSPSSPVVQTDVNDILLNSALSNDGSTYEVQPLIDSESDPLSSSNQDDNSTQFQPSQPTPSDSSAYYYYCLL